MYTYSVYIMYCRHRDYVYIINHIYICVCYTTTIQHYWMTHPAAQNKQKSCLTDKRLNACTNHGQYSKYVIYVSSPSAG